MHEESPEGGRFKKEIFINDQSYLLLIRDEGGVPEAQVCNKIALFHTYFSPMLTFCINNKCLC